MTRTSPAEGYGGHGSSGPGHSRRAGGVRPAHTSWPTSRHFSLAHVLAQLACDTCLGPTQLSHTHATSAPQVPQAAIPNIVKNPKQRGRKDYSENTRKTPATEVPSWLCPTTVCGLTSGACQSRQHTAAHLAAASPRGSGVMTAISGTPVTHAHTQAPQPRTFFAPAFSAVATAAAPLGTP